MNKSTPYNGEFPFVFISYAHKDYDIISKFLDKLYENNYIFWYDEGIKSGAEWADFIVERIKESRVFLVFLSNNSINSDNVKDEIHVAVSLQKTIIVVKLDEIELSGGLLLKLDRRQAINYYELGLEKSFNKLIATSEINDCVEISTNDVFITYPDDFATYGKKSEYETAVEIESIISCHSGMTVHIDQRAKIPDILSFKLENGRLEELKESLSTWINEQNDIKAKRCNTLIIVLDDFNELGGTISRVRDFFYFAKNNKKQVIFVLKDDIKKYHFPVSNYYVPLDLQEFAKTNSISVKELKEGLFNKLDLVLPPSPVVVNESFSFDIKKLVYSHPFLFFESTGEIVFCKDVDSDLHVAKITIDFQKSSLPWGRVFLPVSPPLDISTTDKIVFNLCSPDQTIKKIWVEINPKSNNWRGESFDFELSSEMTTYEIKISDFENPKTAKCMGEILFNVRPDSFTNKDCLKGCFSISNIQLLKVGE